MVGIVSRQRTRRLPIPDFIPAFEPPPPRAGVGRPRKPRPICANPLCSTPVRRLSSQYCSTACRYAVLRSLGLRVDYTPAVLPEVVREGFRLNRRRVPMRQWPPEVREAYLDYIRTRRRMAAERKRHENSSVDA